MKKWWGKSIITVIALIIVVVRWRWPEILPNDTLSIFLLVLAALPWLFQLFRSIELPGGLKVDLSDHTDEDQKKVKAQAETALAVDSTTQKVNYNWNNVASVFWLGNDLMWVIDATHQHLSPERIHHSIQGCIKYLRDIGFTDESTPIKQLSVAERTLKSLAGIDPSIQSNRFDLDKHYIEIRRAIEMVKWYINGLAVLVQKDFKKHQTY